jgi:chemotaxis response regulator CheB
MPAAALRYVQVDYILPVREIASTLVRLCEEVKTRGEEYD